MYEYEIKWHTKPAPGCTYYTGISPLRSNYDDVTEVEDQFLRSMERNGFHHSLIQIDTITKKVK